MNWNYRKPTFTSITDLVNATGVGFTMKWDYSDPTVKYYNIYRHIENKVTGSENGGLNNDPTGSGLQSTYKLIATIQNGSTEFNTKTFIDTLTNLSVHNSEGITHNGTKWIDTDGRDVVEEIYKAQRRIYYKIEASTATAMFNATPFIYVAHTNGVECRSIITQVYDNTLYYEGDVVWFNTTLGGIQRIAVDTTYNAIQNRKRNVWASGTNKLYCLNGDTGAIVFNLTPSVVVGKILGLRVDPDTGDAIFIGETKSIFRASALTGAILAFDTIPTSTNNNGLVISKQDGNHYAYTINNYDTISKIGLDSRTNVNYPRTNFGCTNSTIANVPNILGITVGTDQGVWVNDHPPVHYVYSYSTTSYSSYSYWAGVCSNNGNIDPYYANQWNQSHAWAISHGLLDYARCDTKHYVTEVTQSTQTFNANTDFLQDVGYIHGVTTSVNNSATNGQLYPYPTSALNVHYYPFTLESGRTGWVGASPQGVEAGLGRPYLGNPTSPNGKDSPSPALSQKGIAAAYPSFGSLSGNSYNIYQVNEIENRIHKLTWNGSNVFSESNRISGLTYSTNPQLSLDYWVINKPTHINIDSQNNLWVTQELPATSELTLVYNLVSTTQFASGGMCRYPTLTSNFATSSGFTYDYVYGNKNNNPYIEYYLTRDTTFATGVTALQTYGVKLSGTLGDQINTARNWCLTNFATNGLRVYPHFVQQYGTATFSRTGGTDTNEYNSDNIGTSMLFNTQEIITSPDFIHPSVSYPQITLTVVDPYCTSINCDTSFWNGLNTSNTNLTSISGYDDFKATLSATLVTSGSFIPIDYTFIYADKYQDVGATANALSTETQSNFISYTYNDPSINGKPFQPRWVGGPAETSGQYSPYCLLNFEPSCYSLSGEEIITSVSSNIVDVTVFERWPTARFYVKPFDTSVIRHNVLTTWNMGTLSAYPVGDNGLTKFNPDRVVYGYDPLSAQFNDMSITRTWPISTWYWSYGDKPTYLGFELNNNNLTTYLHVTGKNINGTTASSTRDDCFSERSNMVEHLYKGPGTYYATLMVAASNTGTTSWNISSGVTDESVMNTTFTPYATARIDVLEVCPAINFSTISGETITKLFSADGTKNPIVSATINYSAPFSTYGVISGYAPYLKVRFEGSLSGRSLPLSAAIWNYSDYYVNPLASDTTRFNPPVTGWPIWNSETYLTTGIHTFVMPGFYNISLIPVVSSYDGYVSNCTDGFKKSLNVYVEEIMPTSRFSVTSSTNVSPVSVVVNPSATIPGSFQICRMVYDFGDGSDAITISRITSSNYMNYYNTSSYNDPADPRNVVLTHDYYRRTFTQLDTYTLTMSAFACNTNSVAIASADIGPIALAKFDDVEGNIHLIENRMYHTDDVLLVFEGDKTLNNYTLLLSSVNT